MRLLKKICYTLIGLIAGIAIGLFIYKEIRASKAKDILIPKHTTALLQVNVDGLFMELMGNAISNPNTYFFAEKDSADRKREKLWRTGMKIPAMLYLFADSSNAETYYTIQKISNIDRFKRFIQTYVAKDLDSIARPLDGGYTYYQQKKLAFLYNESQVIFAIGKDSTDRSASMLELLNSTQQDWIPAHSWTSRHADQHGNDLLWTSSNKDWISMDFQNGSIHADAFFSSEQWRFPDAPQALAASGNPVLHAYLDADLSAWLKAKDSLWKDLKVPVDSLYKYYGGYIDLQWMPKDVKQMETIISYEYDDNFEMKEVKQEQEVDAPNLLVRLKASPHLLGYLPEKLFYKFKRKSEGDIISLSTDTGAGQTATFEKAKTVFNLTYQKNASVIKHLGWLPFFDRWEKIRLEGRARTTNGLQLHGFFILPHAKLHALYQLSDN